MSAVEVRNLVVRYGGLVAVDGIDLRAEAGEVLTLLGPNGAGKTSTVETLEGFRRPAAGTARIVGLDPQRDHPELTARVGVMLQEGGVHPGMGPAEALALYASFYPEPEDPGALLGRLGLERVARTPWRRLSGGEQRRLSLALALVGRPEVAFLDEPTSGVDVEGRLVIRQVISELRDAGVCVVLTTHELEEAERLADRVVIIDRGRVVASGTPAELVSRDRASIRFGAPPGLDTAALGGHLGAPVTEEAPGEYLAATAATPGAVAALTGWLAERNLPLADLRAGRERLEDVFLRLTAGGARPGPAGQAGAVTAAPVGVPRPGAGGWPRPAGSEQGTGAAGRGRAARGAADRWAALEAQVGAELRLTLRRGDSVLLTLAIPVGLLVFFSLVDVLPKPAGVTAPVTFLAPGILALAVMSTAMVSLGIATGFERHYRVLKRLGATPLGRPSLLGAKIAAVAAIEALQVVVVVVAGLLLGWGPGGRPALAVPAVVLATVAFAGLGLLMAGTLRAEVTLAAANGLYLALLLLGGMVFPLSKLPSGLRAFAEGLPAGALSDALHGSLTAGATVPGRAWIVLAAWAVVMPVAAARTFRWE